MVVAPGVEHQQNGRAANGNGAVGDVQVFSRDEGRDHTEQYKQTFPQQAPVGDGGFFIYFHDLFPAGCGCGHFAAPEEVKYENHDDHHGDDNRGQLIDKVHE